MAGYWPSSFFAFLWTSTSSRSEQNNEKIEEKIVLLLGIKVGVHLKAVFTSNGNILFAFQAIQKPSIHNTNQ